MTGPSTLLRVTPPLCPASVLWLLWGIHLSGSLDIGATGSHVPHISLNSGHAAFMPDAIWAVSRCLPDSSRVNDSPPGFDVVPMLSTGHQRFACARLLSSYLTESSSAFSSTLTTPALNRRSLRWFAACSCKPAARGLPSSHVQHGCSGYLRHKYSFAPSWRTVVGIPAEPVPSALKLFVKVIQQDI